MKKSILLLLFAVTTFYSCKDKHSNLPDGLYAEIETNKGSFIVELDYKKAPVTVANFVTLAEGKNEFVTNENLKNKPYFDGLKFHRVIENFMIQTGDPLGTGSGDAGYKFKDEFSDLKFDKAGVLAMANNGPGTNSSQFFITHVETPWLDGKHTIFGHIVENGQETVNKVVQGDDLISINIIRNGEAAKKFDAVKVFHDYFAEIAKEKSKYTGVQKEKVAYYAALKAKATKTTTGLEYVITEKSNGKKPVNEAQIYIHYAGFLEDGTLFDSSIEEINKTFGKFDAARAQANGYQPIPFQAGRKDGMIPGFIEAIETLPNFKTVLNAIQLQLPINFNHHSFYHLKEEIYTLKPYFLKQYQNRWYVIGETEKGYRTFGIDRIENITIGTKKFKPKTEEAKDKFSHVIGLNYVDHKMETIKLAFHISQKPYLISLPLHSSQKEFNPENDETFDIKLFIHPNFEFQQQILKYGSLVKVLEPKWLAIEIKEEQRKAFESY